MHACVSKRNQEEATLLCIFTEEVKVSENPAVYLDDQEVDHIKWISSNGLGDSCIWHTSLPLTSSTNHQIKMNFLNGKTARFEMPSVPSVKIRCETLSSHSNELSELTKKTLLEIKDNCVTLDELEPDNKWVLLTLVDVLWAIDFSSYSDVIGGYLSQLENLDPIRKNYYCDIRSKLLMIKALNKDINETQSDKFVLQGSGITRIYECHNLACYSIVHLNDNKLSSISPLRQLVLCYELILDDNEPIKDISPLANISTLRKLSIKNCGIKSLEDVEKLQCLTNLEYLDLRCNPVCANNEAVDGIKSIFNYVNSLYI